MTAVLWGVAVLAVWVAVAAALGLVIGRAVRRRDRQVQEEDPGGHTVRTPLDRWQVQAVLPPRVTGGEPVPYQPTFWATATEARAQEARLMRDHWPGMIEVKIEELAP